MSAPDRPTTTSRLQSLAQAINPAAAAPPAANERERSGPLSNDELRKLKQWLISRVSTSFDDPGAIPNNEATRREVHTRLLEALATTRLPLPESLKAELLRDLSNEFFGYGPIQPLLEDPEVTEVMVNGPRRVYAERGGKVTLTSVRFDDDEHVRRVIDRIILPLGRRIDYDTPLVDARLPDGSRVNAVIPPVAIDGPSVTIRKFSRKRLTIEDLVRFNSVTPQIAEFLKACIVSRLNVVVSGGTGSGKTTLLNVLSGFIPADERIVTIEDAAELQLHQEHVVRLESKKANLDGRGEVTIRDLVRNALRMRPERIIVGECRGGEALDMLQAMNTGHDGSLTTLHANAPRDAVSRLETMCLMAGLDFPLKVVREQIASAVELIVQQTRLRDGTRRVTQVTEVAGMEGDTVVLQDIFKFTEEGLDADNKVVGVMRATGLRPIFTPKLEAAGFRLPAEIFATGLSPREARRR
ncbi:MAG: CpaF family protein [Anaerolineales bacterium]|nr:CpaF family protein [Anaerolineales bacterium]